MNWNLIIFFVELRGIYHTLLMRTRVLILFLSVQIRVAIPSVESMVKGYHVYMDHWSPSVGDEFELGIEELNRHERYAVAI